MHKCKSIESFSIIFILLFPFLALPNISFCKTEKDRVVILNPNQPFKEQVKERNTSYIIKDSYDLCGETIVLPNNCELVFDGGYITNGCLKGRNSIIAARKERIFDNNISFCGKWRDFNASPEWYGAVGGGLTDDSNPLQLTIDNFNSIILTDTYLVNSLHIEKSLDIKGGCLKAFLDSYGNTRNLFYAYGDISLSFNGVSFDGSGDRLANNGVLEQMLLFTDCERISFTNCSFYRHSQNSSLSDELEWQNRKCYAISVLGVKEVSFEGCIFHDNLSEQVAIGSNTKSKFKKPFTELTIQNCSCYNNESALALFILFELKKAVIVNNDFRDNGRTFLNLLTDNLLIINNKFTNTNSRAITTESEGNYYSVNNVVIKNNIIRNAREGFISVGNKNIVIKDNTLINDTLACNFDYLIRLGGVYTGENSLSIEANNVIPFYNNSFSKCKEGGNIIIIDNVIKGKAKRGGIAIRVTELINNNWLTEETGTIKNIQIQDNTVTYVGSGYPIYFPDGSFSNIDIERNTIISGGANPFLCISPSPQSEIIKSTVKELNIANNHITYTSLKPIDYLFKSNCSIATRIKIKDNEVNVDVKKGFTNLRLK